MATSVEDLKTLRSSSGRHKLNETLHARIATALKKIIKNSNFKKKVHVEEQKAQEEDRFLLGRQIAYLIYEYFRVTGANDSAADRSRFRSTNSAG